MGFQIVEALSRGDSSLRCPVPSRVTRHFRGTILRLRFRIAPENISRFLVTQGQARASGNHHSADRLSVPPNVPRSERS